MWRLVMEGTAKLGELSGPTATYSLVDCYKANALLDMRADIEQAARGKERKS